MNAIEVPTFKAFQRHRSEVHQLRRDVGFLRKPLGWKLFPEDPIVEKIGSGYRSRVVRTESGRVFKIARGELEDAYKVYIELLVNRHLRENQGRYQIPVDRILSSSGYGVYLEKEMLDQRFIASNFVSRNSDLKKRQRKALETIFWGGVRYAKEQGVGLDLKASNLYWDKGKRNWVLFDAGTRTSHYPFGYTSDLKSFDEFLDVWLKEEPDD